MNGECVSCYSQATAVRLTRLLAALCTGLGVNEVVGGDCQAITAK